MSQKKHCVMLPCMFSSANCAASSVAVENSCSGNRVYCSSCLYEKEITCGKVIAEPKE